MQKDVVVISYETTYEEVRSLLSDNMAIRSFPLVDSKGKITPITCTVRLEYWLRIIFNDI